MCSILLTGCGKGIEICVEKQFNCDRKVQQTLKIHRAKQNFYGI